MWMGRVTHTLTWRSHVTPQTTIKVLPLPPHSVSFCLWLSIFRMLHSLFPFLLGTPRAHTHTHIQRGEWGLPRRKRQEVDNTRYKAASDSGVLRTFPKAMWWASAAAKLATIGCRHIRIQLPSAHIQCRWFFFVALLWFFSSSFFCRWFPFV